MPVDWVVVGLDNGGTTNNGTILDSEGRFLLDEMAEVPSNVREGPDKAIQSLIDAVEQVLALTGVPLAAVRAIGLDTPGPASASTARSCPGRSRAKPSRSRASSSITTRLRLRPFSRRGRRSAACRRRTACRSGYTCPARARRPAGCSGEWPWFLP